MAMKKRKLNMSFEAEWGLDPDRAIQAQGLSMSEIETDRFTI